MIGDGVDEIIVELLGNIPRKLEMLLLIFADGNMGCAVDENIGGHQGGIGVEADGCVFAVLASLFLELRHPVEPAEACRAIENPGQFRVLGNLTLVEDDVLLRVDAAGDESGGHFTNICRKRFRILRDRDGVQIHDTINAVMAFLKRHEFRDCAQIITEMQISGRLNAGKHQFLETRHQPNPPPDGAL